MEATARLQDQGRVPGALQAQRCAAPQPCVRRNTPPQSRTPRARHTRHTRHKRHTIHTRHTRHTRHVLCTGKRLWSYDLWRKPGEGGAPKRYLAATPEALAEAYATMAAVKRNVYEVITPEWPCVLYFDLEFARDEHGEQ